ncbi:UDP-N-acetylmuramate dehydrogenase [Patescibacteria group bacterium]|nr:UDP-N-acetylmuramate dehydrogenase [Patescibacteria group bacterium]
MADIITEFNNNQIGPVLAEEPLKNHTNFKIGGPAKYFFTALNTADLIKAVQVANELNVKTFYLGLGSNVLVSDGGLDGLVIKIKTNQLKITDCSVVAEAGVNLAWLVQQIVAAGLTGLEPLVGVPGTVGGAIYGNAGLPKIKQGFMGDWVNSVTVLRQDKIITLTKEACNFSYRQSLFKTNEDVILSVNLKLNPGVSAQSRELMATYIKARQNQPYNKPSSGCIFTNLVIENPAELRSKFPNNSEIEDFIKQGGQQLPAAWLIDQAGLKGKTMGDIKISEEHANYLLNLGQGTAEQVIMMISYIKQQVRDKFGYQLKEEIKYLGF